MIAWRTSQFLIMFLVVQLAIVGIVAYTYVYRGVTMKNKDTEAIVLVTGKEAGQPVSLPQYPSVEIRTPAVSLFDSGF